jgi:hypothetical protein
MRFNSAFKGLIRELEENFTVFLSSFRAKYGSEKLPFYFTNHSKTLSTPCEQNLKT